MSSAIKDLPKPLFQILSQTLKQYSPGMVTSELGVVVNASSGVAHLRGLSDVSSNELIKLPNDLMGLATSINEAEVGLILRALRVLDIELNARVAGTWSLWSGIRRTAAPWRDRRPRPTCKEADDCLGRDNDQ